MFQHTLCGLTVRLHDLTMCLHIHTPMTHISIPENTHESVQQVFPYAYVYICVCVCIYIYIWHIYIYIYVCICMTYIYIYIYMYMTNETHPTILVDSAWVCPIGPPLCTYIHVHVHAVDHTTAQFDHTCGYIFHDFSLCNVRIHDSFLAYLQAADCRSNGIRQQRDANLPRNVQYTGCTHLFMSSSIFVW